MSDARRTADRLLRCYPASWRAVYGDEFRELLRDDLAERPHSARRTLDVVRGGLTARLVAGGLAGVAAVRDRQVALSGAWMVASFAVFVTFGVALWSQLLTSWRWEQPRDVGTTGASWVISVMMLLLVLVAITAVGPLLVLLARELRARRRRGLVRSTVCLLTGIVTLLLGAWHFSHGWPGTNGHHVSSEGWIPARVGSLAWAATMSITSYWAHLRELGAFPTSELVWMLLSPLALLLATAGAVGVVRRLHFSDGVVRFETALGRLTLVAMAFFILGASVWVVDGTNASHDLFHRGLIDDVDLLVMVLSLGLAWRAQRRVPSSSLGGLPSTPRPTPLASR